MNKVGTGKILAKKKIPKGTIVPPKGTIVNKLYITKDIYYFINTEGNLPEDPLAEDWNILEFNRPRF